VKRAPAAAVSIALTRGRTVEVEVLDAAGDPVADADVHAAARDEDRDAPWAPGGIEDIVWRGVHVSAGTYRVSGLPPGEIVFVVTRDGATRRATHDAREGRATVRF
jgi:hypothetical protein